MSSVASLFKVGSGIILALTIVAVSRGLLAYGAGFIAISIFFGIGAFLLFTALLGVYAGFLRLFGEVDDAT